MNPSSRRCLLPLVLSLFLLGSGAYPAFSQNASATGQGLSYSVDTPIDPEHARAVMQKKQSGATLTADEQAYFERVQEMLRKRRAEKGDAVAKAPAGPASGAGWEHLADGSYGKELAYTGVGGISLPGYIRKPEGNGPFPAIVFLHGGMAYPPGKGGMVRQGQNTASPFGDFLKQGWVVYGIDYRQQENPIKSVLDPMEIDDSVEAIKTLRQQTFIDWSRIGIMGGSHGAQLSSRLISRVPLGGAIICAPACFELPETKTAIAQGAKINNMVKRIIEATEKKYGATCEDFAKDPSKYGYTSAFTEVADVKCPVLLVNGKNDDNSLFTVVNSYAEKLRAAGKQAEVYFPDNGPHGFYTGHPDIPEYQECTRLSVEFFKRQFARADTTPSVAPAPAAKVPERVWSGQQITNPKTTPYEGQPITYRYPPHDQWNTPRESLMSFVDPIKESPNGTVYKTFHSQTIDGAASYLVWLPPGYEAEKNIRYPVLYYLGASGSSPKKEAAGVQPFVTKAIASKEALPFIVIYTPSLCGNTMYCDTRDGKYPLETMIIRDLIPHVDATYRTIARREARGVEGFSMGGFGTAHLGFKFPELFGVISIKAPPLVEPDSKWHQVQQAWGNLFPTAMAGDMEYFKANDPFTLVAVNAAKLRDGTYIRLTTHILTGENWIQARVEDLDRQLKQCDVPHELHIYDTVKTHNPVQVFNCQGATAFDYFNSVPAELRAGR